MFEKQSFKHQMLLNLKDLQTECFQKCISRTSFFLIYFYFKNRITLPFPSFKVSKSSMINAKLNPTEINAKLYSTV